MYIYTYLTCKIILLSMYLHNIHIHFRLYFFAKVNCIYTKKSEQKKNPKFFSSLRNESEEDEEKKNSKLKIIIEKKKVVVKVYKIIGTLQNFKKCFLWIQRRILIYFLLQNKSSHDYLKVTTFSYKHRRYASCSHTLQILYACGEKPYRLIKCI